MAEKRKVYWDACMWFALIKQEPDRFDRCQYIVELARRGDVEIWTSTLTLAEVFRKLCGGPEASSLPIELDQEFEDFLAQDFVVEVQLDRRIGVQARRLLRSHGPLKKPQDAVHLASAVWNDLDELHTFDQVNLLSLNGLINTRGGRPLLICEPPERPLDLFTGLSPIAPPALANMPAADLAPASSAPTSLVAAATAPAPAAGAGLFPTSSAPDGVTAVVTATPITPLANPVAEPKTAALAPQLASLQQTAHRPAE